MKGEEPEVREEWRGQGTVELGHGIGWNLPCSRQFEFLVPESLNSK